MDDYKTLKVKFNKNIKSHHCLYYKPHKLQKSSSDDQQNDEQLASRTLFVYNVPPYADIAGLRNVFSCYGSVQHVLLYTKPTRNPFAALSSDEKKRSSFFRNIFIDNDDEFSIEAEKTADNEFCFKVAYVVFAQSESIERAVNKPVKDKVREIQDTSKKNEQANQIKVGLQKWIADYEKELINEAKLSKEIDEYMQSYDSKKEKEDAEMEATTNQPDEDGWVTVTQKNRKSNRPFTERNIEKIQKKIKKKRQQMQLVNFYSFQMKESKKEYVAQLRKKFEEDKKKIETMKINRKFKPF